MQAHLLTTTMATFPNLRQVVAVILVALLVAIPHVESAISCGRVGAKLAPCRAYVVGTAAKPSSACCSGVSAINSMASTTATRRAVCKCLMSIVPKVKGVKLGLVKGLPGKCGVSVPYPISPSTNCETIS